MVRAMPLFPYLFGSAVAAVGPAIPSPPMPQPPARPATLTANLGVTHASGPRVEKPVPIVGSGAAPFLGKGRQSELSRPAPSPLGSLTIGGKHGHDLNAKRFCVGGYVCVSDSAAVLARDKMRALDVFLLTAVLAAAAATVWWYRQRVKAAKATGAKVAMEMTSVSKYAVASVAGEFVERESGLFDPLDEKIAGAGSPKLRESEVGQGRMALVAALRPGVTRGLGPSALMGSALGLGLPALHTATPLRVPARVGHRALPEFMFGIQIASLPEHFLAALIPGAMQPVALSKPVQAWLKKIELIKPEKLLNTTEDESVAIQRAFDPVGKHSNLAPYLPSLKNLGNFVQRTQGSVTALNFVAAAALFYDTYLIPQGYRSLALPLEPFLLGALAIGFQIINRVGRANDHFALAKNLMGDMLSTTRDLGQQASYSTSQEAFVEFARLLPAFAVALTCDAQGGDKQQLAENLRKAGDVVDSPDMRLTGRDIHLIINRPEDWTASNYVLFMLRHRMAALGLSDDERKMMEANIQRLIKIVGAVESLSEAEVPENSNKNSDKLLLGWLSVLPFALEAKLGMWTVFAEQILAIGLLGVQDGIKQMEKPMETLPMQRLSTQLALETESLKSVFAAVRASERKAFDSARAENKSAVFSAKAFPNPMLESILTEEEPAAVPWTTAVEEPLPAPELREMILKYEHPDASEDEAAVRMWLTGALSKYADTFMQEGYDSMQILKHAQDDELQQLAQTCKMPPGHARHFVRRVEALRESSDEHAAVEAALLRHYCSLRQQVQQVKEKAY